MARWVLLCSTVSSLERVGQQTAGNNKLGISHRLNQQEIAIIRKARAALRPQCGDAPEPATGTGIAGAGSNSNKFNSLHRGLPFQA